MTAFSPVLKSRIEKLNLDDQRRGLHFRQGIDFSSNDYLGLSQDETLKKIVADRLQMTGADVPLGASGSRLLRGHLEIYSQVESQLADFCGHEAALLFPTGYQANVGLMSSLLRPGDVVFSDQYNHASLIDGMRLSGAQRRIYPHGDVQALRSLLVECSDRNQLKIIVTESLFSMDGDLAPLAQLADLAEEFSAYLVVDEAHATGLWGKLNQNQGGGLSQSLGLSQRVLATVHTGGKALGVSGAWVCGRQLLKEYLINFSRPFIFSTAPLPLLGICLMSALEYWKEIGPSRVEKMFQQVRLFKSLFKNLRSEGSDVLALLPGPIIPIILGENFIALSMAQELQKAGWDVRAIRPPTVPDGSARLRITIHATHTDDQIRQLGEALVQASAQAMNRRRG